MHESWGKREVAGEAEGVDFWLGDALEQLLAWDRYALYEEDKRDR